MQVSNVEIQVSEQIVADVNQSAEVVVATTVRFSDLQCAGGGQAGVSW